MQDLVVDGLEATLLAVGKTGILIQGTGEEDHALHTVGGRMIMTHIGGARSAPCLPVVVAMLDRPYKYNSKYLSSLKLLVD